VTSETWLLITISGHLYIHTVINFYFCVLKPSLTILNPKVQNSSLKGDWKCKTWKKQDRIIWEAATVPTAAVPTPTIPTIDVKYINLQIKKHKTCFFFTFIKNCKKTWKKTLNYSIHSSKKHSQYESNKVNNTATKHSLCPGNGVYMSNYNKATSHTRQPFIQCPQCHCLTLHHICNFVRLCFNNNKNTTLKSTKKHKSLIVSFLFFFFYHLLMNKDVYKK